MDLSDVEVSLDLFDVIRSRRSVRKFKDQSVGDEEVVKVLKAGVWAPSAGNLQSRDYVVVRDGEVKRELVKAAEQQFIFDAPVVIVVCANMERASEKYGDRGYNLYSIQDATAAVQNMLLTVHALGLGSCWIGAFDEERVSEVLGLPSGVRPVSMLPIGHPDVDPNPPKRYPLEKFVHEEKW
ncbi:nitroreductase family protein [Methanonatronarchaeum sp. AMET-Sl]|uniref:nitroreductase family protein n=1 Tax=Methanonatronarchaeum sp. AMET-Sl TaxID=3037654 RepID=UPI00244DB7B5|nr:nitroreductase family protein [Methanonatronarchaeum sp. AMET-Sl]WGI16850.1 nitroreductase family protein [Methanonatronarchaeum sp. AMET-Sl]